MLVRKCECQVIDDLRGLALLVDPLPPGMNSAGGGSLIKIGDAFLCFFPPGECV